MSSQLGLNSVFRLRSRTALLLLTATSVGAVALVTTNAFAATGAVAVPLGTANSFALLAGSGITNTGTSRISGDIGTYPTPSETGFSTLTLNGTNDDGNTVTQGAKTDLIAAYNSAFRQTPTGSAGADLGGQTLIAGVYNSSSTVGLTGTLTLNGGGNANSIFIFQAGSSLTTASSSSIVLTNGAQACNVFWQVTSSATLGTNSSFVGTILALTSITASTGATVDGRLLARNGDVTLDGNTVTVPSCASTSTTGATSTTSTTGATSTTSTTGATSTTSTTGVSSTSSTTGTPGVTAPSSGVTSTTSTGSPGVTAPSTGTTSSSTNSVVVPSTKTGEAWSGWIWWMGAISVGVGGVILVLPRRRRLSTRR